MRGSKTSLRKRIRIRTDWATGEYNYTSLADKYDVGTKTIKRVLYPPDVSLADREAKADEDWKNFGAKIMDLMAVRAPEALMAVSNKEFLRYAPHYAKFFKSQVKSLDITSDGDINIIMENTGEKLLANEI